MLCLVCDLIYLLFKVCEWGRRWWRRTRRWLWFVFLLRGCSRTVTSPFWGIWRRWVAAWLTGPRPSLTVSTNSGPSRSWQVMESPCLILTPMVSVNTHTLSHSLLFSLPFFLSFLQFKSFTFIYSAGAFIQHLKFETGHSLCSWELRDLRKGSNCDCLELKFWSSDHGPLHILTCPHSSTVRMSLFCIHSLQLCTFFKALCPSLWSSLTCIWGPPMLCSRNQSSMFARIQSIKDSIWFIFFKCYMIQ